MGDGILNVASRTQPVTDRMMTLILQLIQAAGKTSTVLEDAFLVVGSLASGKQIAIMKTKCGAARL